MLCLLCNENLANEKLDFPVTYDTFECEQMSAKNIKWNWNLNQIIKSSSSVSQIGIEWSPYRVVFFVIIKQAILEAVEVACKNTSNYFGLERKQQRFHEVEKPNGWSFAFELLIIVVETLAQRLLSSNSFQWSEGKNQLAGRETATLPIEAALLEPQINQNRTGQQR